MPCSTYKKVVKVSGCVEKGTVGIVHIRDYARWQAGWGHGRLEVEACEERVVVVGGRECQEQEYAHHLLKWSGVCVRGVVDVRGCAGIKWIATLILRRGVCAFVCGCSVCAWVDSSN